MPFIHVKRSVPLTAMRMPGKIALAVALCAGCGDGPASVTSSADSASAALPDVTAPVATILSPSMGDTLRRDGTNLTFRVTEDHGLRELRVLIDDIPGSEPVEWIRASGDLSYLEHRNGELRGTRFPSSLPDGTYGLEIEAVDLAGNVGRSSRMHYTFASDVNPENGSAIDVQSFWVIEFQYPGEDDWYYAPQAVVANPTDHDIEIVAFQLLTIPGLASPFPRASSCGHTVRGGQSLELFPESYGDWPLVFYGSHRSAAGLATALLLYRDVAGETHTIELEGPIAAGALPGTYSGGRGWGC